MKEQWMIRYSRTAHLGYVMYELLRAKLSRKRGVRILFSDRPEAARPALEKWFPRTRHRIAFGEFREDQLPSYDLLLPLHVQDVFRLSTMRQHLTGNLIPLPPDSAIEVCCDKLLFHQTLERNGFARYLASRGEEVGFPCVLKKRIDEAGRNTQIVHDAEQEKELMDGFDREDYLRLEYIDGSIEFTAHVLFIGGKVVRALTVRHEMEREGLVKGRANPIRGTLVRSAHLDVFSDILRLIGYEGLCNIDYKLKDGRPVVMEINPRIGGSMVPYIFSFIRSLPCGSDAPVPCAARS